MRLFFYLIIALNTSILLRAQPGGNIDITAGAGDPSGGDINITSGDAGSDPGDINITTGSSGSKVGNINIETPISNMEAGNILISSGDSNGGGGGITLQTGNSIGMPSDINLTCGTTVGGSDINLTAGDGEDGGNITLTPGVGSPNPNGLVIVNGSGTYTGSWTSASDERFKKNINHLENSLNSVLQLRGISYEFKTEEFPEKKFNDGKQIGLIAQEVEKVYPEFVETDSEGYKSVAYQNLVAVLIEAIKEQQKQIENLTGRIENLENKFAGDFVEVSSLNK